MWSGIFSGHSEVLQQLHNDTYAKPVCWVKRVNCELPIINMRPECGPTATLAAQSSNRQSYLVRSPQSTVAPGATLSLVQL